MGGSELMFHAECDTISSAVVDIGLLVLYSVVAIAGAFVAFLRYDVR